MILDAGARIGDPWRQRWDSLRLFTPAKYNGLPGSPFPGDLLGFPTKDEQADYLEDYASRFHLPVRPNTAVTRLGHDGTRFHLTAGAEIALESSRTHETWLAGKPSAEIPFRHGRTAARFFIPVVRFAGMHVLHTNTPVGRKVLPKMATMATPLIRTKRADLGAAGVHLVPRVAGVQDGEVILDGGQSLAVANVIWCTGFTEDHPWRDIPALPADWRAQLHRGIVDALPCLYLLGKDFIFAAASETLPGVSRDAKYLAKHLAATRAPQKEAEVQRGVAA